MDKDLSDQHRLDFIEVEKKLAGLSFTEWAAREAEYLEDWPASKKQQFWLWELNPDEPESRAWAQDQEEKKKRKTGMSPDEYIKMLKTIDFSKEEDLGRFVGDSQHGYHGALPLPIYLFRNNFKYYYLCSHYVDYQSYRKTPMGETHRYIIKFEPPLQQHPPQKASATNGPSLQYALLLGSLSYGSRNGITDEQELQPTPFIAAISPGSRDHLWIHFDCFRFEEEDGKPEFVAKAREDPFWAEVGFKGSMVVGRVPLANIQLDSTTSPTYSLAYANCDGPNSPPPKRHGGELQILVDANDPAWNTSDPMDGIRPIRKSVTKNEFKEYWAGLTANTWTAGKSSVDVNLDNRHKKVM